MCAHPHHVNTRHTDVRTYTDTPLHTHHMNIHTHTPSEHTRSMNVHTHTNTHSHVNAHTEHGVVSRTGRLQLRGVNTKIEKPEAGAEMRPKFRGWGAGLQPGRAVPKWRSALAGLTTGAAGRTPARAPSSAQGGTGALCHCAQGRLQVSPVCLALAHPPLFPKALGSGDEGSWDPPQLSPCLRPPTPRHAGRSVGPKAVTLREGCWD